MVNISTNETITLEDVLKEALMGSVLAINGGAHEPAYQLGRPQAETIYRIGPAEKLEDAPYTASFRNLVRVIKNWANDFKSTKLSISTETVKASDGIVAQFFIHTAAYPMGRDFTIVYTTSDTQSAALSVKYNKSHGDLQVPKQAAEELISRIQSELGKDNWNWATTKIEKPSTVADRTNRIQVAAGEIAVHCPS